jgi:SAM-dependent methyltransferase
VISVFTPLSLTGNRYIEAAYETLCTQTYHDWEWVVLENHGGSLPKKIRKDQRVKVYGDTQLEGIGALKRRCCELSKGDILFEFDHDDLLHETALKEAHAALMLKDGADFVVSDFAEFHSETWSPNTYRADCGWTHYPVTFQGHELLAQPNPPITPQNLRRVEWAPNHLRAWRTEAYWKVGGHNPELPVIDDHELIVRGYLAGLRYKHIQKCLYFYRVHKEQTVTQKNQLIQTLTGQIYDKYIFELAEKFCADATDQTGQRTPLRKIDLCGGIDTYKDYEPIDKTTGYDLDDSWDPPAWETTRNGTRHMPVANPRGLKDNSAGVIRAFDAIEHLKNPIHTMNEAYRVLAPGGFLFISVPSTDGRGAFQDPTHVSFWNENSFWYYTRASHSRYIPDFKGRFQVTKLRSYFPGDVYDAQGNLKESGFHRQHAIPYVEAHLIALKPGYAPMGEVLI